MSKPTRQTSPARWAQYRVPAGEAGLTVQEILLGPMRLSRRMLQRLTRAHGVQLNRRAAFLGRKVKEGDVVSAAVEWPEDSDLAPVAMRLSIPYEDGDLLAVDKPPFMLVHPTSAEHRATLAHGVAHHLRQEGLRTRVRPVHRIDRDTSGLVLFAKSSVAHHRLDLQLRDHTLCREYLAFVEGEVAGESGEIRAAIGRHPGDPRLRAVRDQGGEEAVTRFAVVECFAGATLLSLELETGRTHQIRVHLSHLGHPLLGDRQYGAPERGIPRQALHSARLSFLHPTSGEPLTVEAPLPEDLVRLRDLLRTRPS